MAVIYGVTLEIAPPGRMQQSHVALRILTAIIIYILPGSAFLLFYYLAVPALVAFLVLRKGGERFIMEDGPRFVRWGRYLLAALAYILFATDRVPSEDQEQTLHLAVQTSGIPTEQSALLRIVYTLPHVAALFLLGLVYIVLWPVTAIYILADETYPDWIFSFTHGYLRWISRVLAYHASLVESYPPFSF